jgi:hypothetical protein
MHFRVELSLAEEDLFGGFFYVQLCLFHLDKVNVKV